MAVYQYPSATLSCPLRIFGEPPLSLRVIRAVNVDIKIVALEILANSAATLGEGDVGNEIIKNGGSRGSRRGSAGGFAIISRRVIVVTGTTSVFRGF